MLICLFVTFFKLIIEIPKLKYKFFTIIIEISKLINHLDPPHSQTKQFRNCFLCCKISCVYIGGAHTIETETKPFPRVETARQQSSCETVIVLQFLMEVLALQLNSFETVRGGDRCHAPTTVHNTRL